ncbi:unnamed protein product [Calypogeia fissa]
MAQAKGIGTQVPHDRPVRKKFILDTWAHPMSCVCKSCTCGVHQCPAYPKFPDVEPIRTVVPFGALKVPVSRMDEISTMRAHYTRKPIHPPPRPPSPPQRWPANKITTYHDHYPEKPLPPPPKSWPPFPERTPFFDQTTYNYFHNKKPPCPVIKRMAVAAKNEHLYLDPHLPKQTNISLEKSQCPPHDINVPKVSIFRSDYYKKPVHPVMMKSPLPTGELYDTVQVKRYTN